MKERPILFSAPMVRAILEGRKTQTRRVVKPQPFSGWYPSQCTNGWGFCHPQGEAPAKLFQCPYGVPGDRLWVRESFQPLLADGVKWPDADYETGEGYAINYVATGGVKEFYDCRNDEAFCSRVTPSIFMPRWASRITLEITEVRVERLQEISREDALAEGCGFRFPPSVLWDSINGKTYPWAANPWVWAVSFRRLV